MSAGGWPVTWSWLQWTGSYEYIAHIETANYQQAIDVLPNQILLLPFEVCQYLLAKQPTLWTIQTIVPVTLTPTHDGASGLDYMPLASNNAWCFDVANQVPAFSDSGPLGNKPARLFYSGGIPYVTYDV
jgi:hypothetical protein